MDENKIERAVDQYWKVAHMWPAQSGFLHEDNILMQYLTDLDEQEYMEYQERANAKGTPPSWA